MFQYIIIVFLLYMFLKFQIDKVQNKPYKSNIDYIKLANEYKM